MEWGIYILTNDTTRFLSLSWICGSDGASARWSFTASCGELMVGTGGSFPATTKHEGWWRVRWCWWLWWWWHIAECWLDYEYWWLFTFRQDRRWWDGKRMTDAWFNKWVVLNSVDLRWILMLLSVLLWGDLKNLDECWKSNNLSDKITEHRVLSRNGRYYQKLNTYSIICNRTLEKKNK